jgi:hypothetical protein
MAATRTEYPIFRIQSTVLVAKTGSRLAPAARLSLSARNPVCVELRRRSASCRHAVAVSCDPVAGDDTPTLYVWLMAGGDEKRTGDTRNIISWPP